MLLVNQDHDTLAEYPCVLQTYPVVRNEIIYGINLYAETVLLGTFDSLDDVLKEINAIATCTEEYYCVTGGDDYDD